MCHPFGIDAHEAYVWRGVTPREIALKFKCRSVQRCGVLLVAAGLWVSWPPIDYLAAFPIVEVWQGLQFFFQLAVAAYFVYAGIGMIRWRAGPPPGTARVSAGAGSCSARL